MVMPLCFTLAWRTSTKLYMGKTCLPALPTSAQVCFFWSSVRIQFLVYAAYLLSFSHLMFLGCIVHNLHLLRTWQTTVRHDPPPAQQQGYVHAAP